MQKWLEKHTRSLKGKTVAISGGTGGLGVPLCKYIARLGADLILLDRNQKKSDALKEEILSLGCNTKITQISLVLDDINSVKSAAEKLKMLCPDYLILNAGAYSIPRKFTNSGYNNIFTINFISPYYLARELYEDIEKRGGKIVAVGSIAHRYNTTDTLDLDFEKRSAASALYGNAKRYLMFALSEKMGGNALSIVHPGITFTNITNHYPKLIFAIIKHPMKIIFMPPKRAALCILKGLFEDTQQGEWIGPRFFDVWGLPKTRHFKCSKEERTFALKTAEEIYNNIKNREA